MAEWLEQASQWHEMYCHDLEVMSLNPSQAELWVLSTFVLSGTWIKIVTNSANATLLLSLFSIFPVAILHAHYVAGDKTQCWHNVIYIMGGMPCEHCWYLSILRLWIEYWKPFQVKILIDVHYLAQSGHENWCWNVLKLYLTRLNLNAPFT